MGECAPNASGVWMADPLMAGDFFDRTVDTLQCPPAEAVLTDVDHDRLHDTYVHKIPLRGLW